MKAILSDSIRLWRNKWFYLSGAFTAFLLWFDFGASGVDMDLLRYGEKTEIVHLMTDLLSGRGNLLSLPLLKQWQFCRGQMENPGKISNHGGHRSLDAG